jgi:hypothetical protein
MIKKPVLQYKLLCKLFLIYGLLALSIPTWVAAAPLVETPIATPNPRVPVPGPSVPPGLISPPRQVIIEAESMSLSQYRVEDNEHASNGQLITLLQTGSNVGEATTVLNDDWDWEIYRVFVDYLDESDGQATIEFWINGKFEFSWTLDKDPGPSGPQPEAFQKIHVGDFSLRPGDELRFKGYKQGSEETRIDRVVLEATGRSEFCKEVNTSRTEPYQFLARLAAKSGTNPSSLRPKYGNPCFASPYYVKIDPQDKRITLKGWWDVNGYNADGSPKDLSKPHAAAQYINANDLYLGRDMHCTQNPNPDTAIACWVTNSLHPDNLDYEGNYAGEEQIVATVTMERRKDLSNAVTYYVYAPDGRRLNAIALDKEKDKSVPEVCYACHGGSHDAEWNPSGGAFLPFDLDAFKQWNAKGIGLSEQESQFALLNRMIYQDSYNGDRIRTAIRHWYNGVIPNSSSRFDDSPPASWFTDPNGFNGNLDDLNKYWHEYGLYTAYATNCRLCHVVEEPGRTPFVKGNIFEAYVKSINDYLCGGRSYPPGNPRDTLDATLLAEGSMMPNAEVTLHRIFEKNRSHGSLIWSDQDHICGWR